ncbi:tyrosine-type recombinase/integrase [Massilia sp. 9096]|uniref:tyrosine-type recombinase/integrase n=1 Tax=Massilia sp. 9096 TaxID=1500894 RepID=UPI0009DF5CED|nr:tyrosine-type recombinase/integrase [Massilia sp. 9096]
MKVKSVTQVTQVTQVTSGKQVKPGRAEKNIYVEVRSGSLRFSVQVSPIPKDSLTFDMDQFDEGLRWARRRRVELLEQKSDAKLKPLLPAPIIGPGSAPADITVRDILENYRRRELPKLAGAASDSSRLKRLDEWFGHLTLGQLDYDRLDRWMADRQAGLLGSGRVSDPKLTKHQKHYRKKAGQVLPPAEIVPPSAQTVRHEITLMRRVLLAYFRANKLNQLHGAWLAAQYVMEIPLPEKPEPRDTRVDEEALALLITELDPLHIAFVRFAVMTTLRRSEVCSLQWEDVNWVKKVVTLRKPGHLKKSKTSTRDVPLLPPALQILQQLGSEKTGRIFEISPSGISQALRRAADRVEMYDVRLHDMRREGISRLVELLEASLEEVMVFSGHSDKAVLQRVYLQQRAHVIGDRLTQHPRAATMISAT